MWSWKPFHCITISPIPSWFVSWTLRRRRRMSYIQWKLFWPFDLASYPWKFFVFLRSEQDMWSGATSERVLTFEISFLNVLLACICSIATALQHIGLWNSWKLFNKTFPESCRLRLYFQQRRLLEALRDINFFQTCCQITLKVIQETFWSTM